ncbi:MAG: YceI family protein [Gemmatimonadaceae bacterium]
MKDFSILIVALSAAAASASAAQAPRNCLRPSPALREYRVDFGHSIVEFSIKFAFTRVKGRFTQANGTILYDSAAPANSSITMILESKSIDTGWPHRDEHLRTSDFFDTDKYPTIEFRSRRLSQTERGWMAEGDLTMHGVTKPITMPFHFLQQPVRSAESRWMVMNVAGELRLARADFGITGGSTFNSWFNKARAATMGDSVDVSMELEAYSPDAASQLPPTVEQAVERIKANGVQSQITRLQELKKTKTVAELEPYFRGADFVIRGLIAACRVPDAAALSKVVTELWPESHSARLINGFVLSVAGDTRAAAVEYARAKELFRAPVRDATEKFPQVDDNWWYMDQLALAALEWGYADRAVPLARTLSALYSGTARAHTTYGQMLAFSGDANGAAAAYGRALQVDPRETRALEWQRRLRL